MDEILELNENLKNYVEKNNLNININNKKELVNFVVSEIQDKFLKNKLADIINKGLDIGIKLVFPNYLSEDILSIKNNLYENGLKEGLDKSIDNIVNLGRNTLGIVSKEFTSIEQAKDVVDSGKIAENISDVLDIGIENFKKLEKNNNQVEKELKNNKGVILENIEKNIDESFEIQIKDMKKLEKYMSNWNKYYENQNFDGMEKEYNKMKKIINNLLPIEETINKYKNIENLQKLIKNNGKNFNLSEDEIELSKKLIN